MHKFFWRNALLISDYTMFWRLINSMFFLSAENLRRGTTRWPSAIWNSYTITSPLHSYKHAARLPIEWNIRGVQVTCPKTIMGRWSRGYIPLQKKIAESSHIRDVCTVKPVFVMPVLQICSVDMHSLSEYFMNGHRKLPILYLWYTKCCEQIYCVLSLLYLFFRYNETSFGIWFWLLGFSRYGCQLLYSKIMSKINLNLLKFNMFGLLSI